MNGQAELIQGSAFFQEDSHVEYDVAPDDRHFLMIRDRTGEVQSNVVYVEN